MPAEWNVNATAYSPFKKVDPGTGGGRLNRYGQPIQYFGQPGANYTTLAQGPGGNIPWKSSLYTEAFPGQQFRMLDYGPRVRGVDIPVGTKAEMLSSQFNRPMTFTPQISQNVTNMYAEALGGYNPYTEIDKSPTPEEYSMPPSDWSPPTSPEEFGPTGPEPSGPSAEPSMLPSPGVEQVVNQYQEQYQYQPPSMPEPTASGDYGGGYPGPTPSELPSPSDIPFYQQQYAYPETAPTTPGANVPTSEYGMTPTGPNEYLPSEGANVPTNEAMYPTGPDTYQPEVGANIPTDESMTPTGPDTYQMPDQTYSYPDGTGGYTTLDASGNPVSDVASAPAQPVFDVTVNDQGPLYGTPGKTTTFGQDISADLTDLGTALGTATPYNTALSGQPGFGQSPSSYQGTGAGAFWSPPGGSIGGTLYGSANAATEQVPFWQRMLMRSAHQYRGNRPYIGGGDAIARFAAQMGPPPPRHQGLYSPVARAQAIAAMAKAGGGAQQGGGGGMDVSPGQARGPGGRAMSPV